MDFIAENETSLCPPPYNKIYILYVTYFGQKFERKNGPSYLAHFDMRSFGTWPIFPLWFWRKSVTYKEVNDLIEVGNYGTCLDNARQVQFHTFKNF